MQIFETKNTLTIINGVECFTLKFKNNSLYLKTNNVEHFLCYCTHYLDYPTKAKLKENNIKELSSRDLQWAIFKNITTNIEKDNINFWNLDDCMQSYADGYYEKELSDKKVLLEYEETTGKIKWK